MTLSIVDFLNARLAEDQTAAEAATPGPWNDDGGCISSAHYQITDYGAYTKANGEPEDWEEQQQRADSAFIARHDPARVIREVAAKRAIIEAVSGLSGQWHDDIEYKVLTSMAEAWRDHPDHPGEWDYEEDDD